MCHMKKKIKQKLILNKELMQKIVSIANKFQKLLITILQKAQTALSSQLRKHQQKDEDLRRLINSHTNRHATDLSHYDLLKKIC